MITAKPIMKQLGILMISMKPDALSTAEIVSVSIILLSVRLGFPIALVGAGPGTCWQVHF
jgi:phosphate/sulfate permease